MHFRIKVPELHSTGVKYNVPEGPEEWFNRLSIPPATHKLFATNILALAN